MIFSIPFYHSVIKKTIISFGSLFSDVQVIRRKADGTPYEIVKVPIAYGPKEKFIQRLDADPELNNGVHLTLPRLAFEITGYNYDGQNQTNKTQRIRCHKPDGTTFIYTPVTYDVNIQLFALTKGTEDGLAIVEQILPLFQPEYNISIKTLPEMNIVVDVPIILNSVSVQDDYEGDFSTHRLVTHVFDFTAKVKFPGPIRSGKEILRTEVTLEKPLNQNHVSEGDPTTGEIITDEWSMNE